MSSKTIPLWVKVCLSLPLLAVPEGVDARSTAVFQDVPIDAGQDPRDLSQVIRYQHFNPGGRTQFCGETAITPDPDNSRAAPLSAHCAALADGIGAVGGYFFLTPSKFDTNDGWAKVARVGTCTFVVRLTGEEPSWLSIGTDDIGFQARSVLHLAKDGRLGLQGDVVCHNGDSNQGVSWGLRRTVEQGEEGKEQH